VAKTILHVCPEISFIDNRSIFLILYAGMETECFGENARSKNLEGKDFLYTYKNVLSTKDKEDSLVSSCSIVPTSNTLGCSSSQIFRPINSFSRSVISL
jgi:hypothetical protein